MFRSLSLKYFSYGVSVGFPAFNQSVCPSCTTWQPLCSCEAAALTQKPARIAKTTESEVDRLLSVNIKSLYHMAVHALPVMRKAGNGSVINIASVTGIRPRPGMTWYNATKAAVLSITQSMAAELAADGIRVNAIAPAAGRTAMFDSMFGDKLDEGIERMLETIPLKRLCEPTDIANAAVYLASDEASFITGIVLPVDGGRLVG
jgi:3-oxoacyl-[acyl-carrier protein] reductase